MLGLRPARFEEGNILIEAVRSRSATPATVTVLIDAIKGDPGVDWQEPDAITFGQSLGERHLDASAEVDWL